MCTGNWKEKEVLQILLVGLFCGLFWILFCFSFRVLSCVIKKNKERQYEKIQNKFFGWKYYELGFSAVSTQLDKSVFISKFCISSLPNYTILSMQFLYVLRGNTCYSAKQIRRVALGLHCNFFICVLFVCWRDCF